MKKLTIIAVVVAVITTYTSTTAQQVDVYNKLSINTQQPYDWLMDVPSVSGGSSAALPVYTPDWSFLERMQSRANSQYRKNTRNEPDYDPNTLICHYHTVSTWNSSTRHWDETPPMYNAASFMFLKSGIAYTEIIPGSEPFTNLFTLHKIDTTSDSQESTLVKWYAQDGQRHDRYKITYFMNKLQRNVVMIFQRFDNTGYEWQRYSFVIDN